MSEATPLPISDMMFVRTEEPAEVSAVKTILGTIRAGIIC